MQVNPLAEDAKGSLIAADAKMGFDDNASYRQKEIFAMKDDSQIDPRWVSVLGSLLWGAEQRRRRQLGRCLGGSRVEARNGALNTFCPSLLT